MNSPASTATIDLPHPLADLGGETMGTTWRVRLSLPRSRRLGPLHDGIQRVLDRVVAQMSTWEADSDISRYNRAAAGSRLPLPTEFRAVLDAALMVAAASDGAFDPTLGPLIELWGFGPAHGTGTVPAPEAVAAARARSGWQRLAIDADGRLLQPGGLQLDLSGIAKGHAADLIAALLRKAGIAGALVEVGGELVGYGRRPDGERWRVLVEALPETPDPTPCVLALDGLAVATSGDHWHHFESDGRRYAHTLDPRTGAPVTDAPAAVTVVAADATQADAWATALTVLGTAEGFALAQRQQLAVRISTLGQTGPAHRTTRAFDALQTGDA